MPFETYLGKTKAKRGVLFHATVLISVFAHAGALAWATVESLTTVEELPAPSVKLSFLRAPTLAAAPPELKGEPEASAGAPAADKGPPRHQGQRPNLRRRPEVPPPSVPEERPSPPTPVIAPTEAAAPPVEPRPETASSAGAGAAATVAAAGPAGGGGLGRGGAGTGTGSGGGVPGGTGAARPRMLPEALGRLQRVSGQPPAFPAHLAKTGASFVAMTKVCVSMSGAVESVEFVKRADPTLDDSIAKAVRTWRYKPLVAGDNAVPFCTFVRFEFRAE